MKSWIKFCESQGIELWPLEKSAGAALYKTQKPCIYNNREFVKDITYHLWIHNHHEVYNNYTAAINAWNNRKYKTCWASDCDIAKFERLTGLKYDWIDTRYHDYYFLAPTGETLIYDAEEIRESISTSNIAE